MNAFMRPPAPGKIFLIPAPAPVPARFMPRSVVFYGFGKWVKQLFEKAFPFYIYLPVMYGFAVCANCNAMLPGRDGTAASGRVLEALEERCRVRQSRGKDETRIRMFCVEFSGLPAGDRIRGPGRRFCAV
jgi:hypothetical protein